VGIVNDSIAIFAFYTDELMIPGGPEGVHGLPGMILGMGIPRLHATWFATKVEVFDVKMNLVKPATKGKKVNRKVMLESLGKVLKDWGTYGSKLIINFVI
jgi:GLPGLI family protein